MVCMNKKCVQLLPLPPKTNKQQIRCPFLPISFFAIRLFLTDKVKADGK